MANLVIKTTEKVLLTAEPQDDNNVKRAVDGTISWASSDDSVVSLVVSADGFTATAVAVASGIATITAAADADLTDGVRLITGSFDIEVAMPPPIEATKIVITAGTPEPK